MIICHYCQRQHDVASRMSGDILLCPCGAWLRIQHVIGGTVATPVLCPIPRQPLQRSYIVRVTDSNGVVWYRRQTNRYSRNESEAYHFRRLTVARARAAAARVWGDVEVVEIQEEREVGG
jgi:hypothetical protein